MLIVRPFLFIVLLSFLACGPSSDEGTEKSRKGFQGGTGKVEDKGKLEELEGRVRTLREKFAELREDPPELSEDAEERWGRLCEKADSLLQERKEELGNMEEAPKEGTSLQKLDRTLQRLSSQARSMERSYEEQEKGHP